MDKLEEMFWSMADETEKCWFWEGYIDPLGYGRHRREYAHRVAYLYIHGVIPKGLEIHHICHNRRCINPEHLKAVTHKENLMMRQHNSFIKVVDN